jgi:hypothetical protein
VEFPQSLQLFPREDNDSAEVFINGYYSSSAEDTIISRFYKNSKIISENVSIPKISNSIKYFSFSYKIHAEESLYRFDVFIKNRLEKLLISRDSIVCGDVFLVLGQSNAHPTNDSANFNSPFCRSFGRLTGNGNYDVYEEKDTTWGLSNAHGFGCRFCGNYVVGVWGLKLQELILQKYQIPTCIINVGTGGSKIEENLKDNNNPLNLNNVYGKLLYRTIKSKTKNKIKAIFWYQGEANSDESWKGYEYNFDKYYSSLKTDFPSFKKFYLFQTRPGCDGEYQSELRNVQRIISRKYSSIEIISTTGINYHDGCHYYLNGYYQIAEQLFLKLEKDFYNWSDDINVSTPDIKKVSFRNKDLKSIELIINQRCQSLTKSALNQIKEYFYTLPFTQQPSLIIQNKDTIILYYEKPNYSNKMSYLPNKYYNNSNYIYEGPFFVNESGIGLLSFIEDIELNRIDILKNTGFSIVCFPNPVKDKFTLRINNDKLSKVKIKITDLNGREVKEYNYYNIKTGISELIISLQNISSGTYFITVSTENHHETSKLIVIK